MIREGRHIHLTGIVQGVGFRPFVYGLAANLHLAGWVRNSSAGVEIEVDGEPPALAEFVRSLTERPPTLAQIDSIAVTERPSNGFTSFEIKPSAEQTAAFQPVAADVTLCPDCLHELFDPADRRYRYPFINCTNCGPRFTIIKQIPYDRLSTTMAHFELCPACTAEYNNPADRRFHAQPVACPACGPQIWLEAGGQEKLAGEMALWQAQRLLQDGRIVAIKGLGGFHLACDARNETAVASLRRRKLRQGKPFAIMLPDLAAVAQHCFVDDAEAALLTSRARPIVILQQRPDSSIAPGVSPDQRTLGVMLPDTPLHYLLFAPACHLDSPVVQPPTALVMTSGNLSEEPTAYRNEAARLRLSSVADAFLMHNREIYLRCDDSVFQVVAPYPAVPLRRSRGYAPFPVKLPWTPPPVLGTGAELKNTFCLSNGRYAFLSHHIGDLENYETLQSFSEGVAHFERLFQVRPALLAYDLHPNYLATRLAQAWSDEGGIPAIGVQHHHAHIAAGMAEHGLTGDRPVIGVAFDGAGYGSDGTIWGGEFLLANYAGFERPYHLQPFPLPGGDKATKEPWRTALACLHQAGLAWDAALPPVSHALSVGVAGISATELVERQLVTGLNAPLTSSMGRLFDAVAALVGVRQTVTYEAQAAVALEALVDRSENGRYPFEITGTWLNPAPLFCAILQDLRQGVPREIIAARFHNSIAWLTTEVCQKIRQQHHFTEVVLSGGVWQNGTLLAKTAPRLEAAGFTVYLHRQVPPNDGGLALGQVAVAAYQYLYESHKAF